MIKKQTEAFKWLEFSLLQEFPRLSHSISLRDFKPQCCPALAKQVHGTKILKLPAMPPLVGDALTTNEKNLPIAIKHADCQAALIYDPICHAASCVHSGWRGSIQNIYGKTIAQMQKDYGSNPADLIMCIGPSLGPDHAEFIHYKTEIPEEFWPFKVKQNHFNFWEISRKQALDGGILAHHLEIAGICTYENEKEFYSYRRDKTHSRHLTIITLL